MEPDANHAIDLLAKMRDQLGASYLAYWALPNVILTLSGARSYCDGVFWNKSDEQLKSWQHEIDTSINFITSQASVIWQEAKISENPDGYNYAGYNLLLADGLRYRLANTGLLKTTTFGQLANLASAEAIDDVLKKDLSDQARFKHFSDENLSHMAFGILVGYPDEAIVGAADYWQNRETDPFTEQLVEADIRGGAYYQCPQPGYLYPRHLVNDSEINANEQLWSKILKDYYTSSFHKSLEVDNAFQQKSKEIGNFWD